LGLSFTPQRALALTEVLGLFFLSFNAQADQLKSYENFDLPAAPPLVKAPSVNTETASAPSSYSIDKYNYSSARVNVKGNVRIYQPSINHQQFMFAKEAFIAEKRDEAIKLLRQELDVNAKKNRDNVLMRLGQLYTEKYMELSYREAELYTSRLEDYEKQKLTDKKAKPPQLENSRSQSYLKQALEVFTGIEREFPHHPKIDEVIFFIGFVELEYGNGDKGQRYLEKLVHTYPGSRKFEDAVLYLGDYYFEKHRFREAIGRYSILVSRRDSPLWHYGLYKKAWSELNTGEPLKGLNEMKLLVSSLDGNKEVSKFNLREQALKDLVIFFGEVGQVDEAIAYFTETLGHDKAIENLKLIADILRSKAKDDAASKAYVRLLEEFGDSIDGPQMQLGLYECLSRLGRNDQAVKNLVAAVEKYGPNSEWAKKYAATKPAELKSTLETLAAEAQKVAFFYHQAAQKSSSKASFRYALMLYDALLKNFPNTPERKKIAFYRADILFNQGDWLNAANSYMEAAQTPPKDKIADESAYYAVLALDNLTIRSKNIERYSKETQKTMDTTPEEIPANEQKFIDVANWYVREYPKADRIVDVQFRIASIYYKHHHFDKALVIFKDIALKNPKHRAAVTSANIVLDIYNIQKQYDQLDTTAALFAHTEGLGDAKFRSEMAEISGQIGFKKIEGFETSNKWKDAGESYLKFYLSNPTGPLAEKALYNSFVSFEKSNDAARTAEISRMFITKYPKSEYTEKMTLNLAKLAEKQYDFESAQRLYNDFYRKYPANKEARKALYNAAVFAEILEMNKVAIDLYNQYLKSREVGDEEKRAIQISLAKLYRKDGNFEKMALIYRRLARDAKSLDAKLTVLAQLAKDYEKVGKISDRDNIVKEIRWQFDSNKGAKLSGPAVQYAAEAKFNSVSPKREKYEKIELRFPPQDLVYLLKRKQRLLKQLAEAYDQVVDFGVPDWGVAALFEKSVAYEEFVKSYRTVKVPAKYKGEERDEAEKALKQIDAQLVKPVETKSQEILKACVDRAAQFFVTNEYAAKCRQKLQKGDSAEVAGEPSGIMPQPAYWTTRWVGGGVAKQ
jgi:cellulose synthase operon protein C